MPMIPGLQTRRAWYKTTRAERPFTVTIERQKEPHDENLPELAVRRG